MSLSIDRQIEAMAKVWPDFRLVGRNGALAAWRGPLRPLLQTYVVEIHYRAPLVVERLNVRVLQPRVYVLAPALRPRMGDAEGMLPHVYYDSDGDVFLCMLAYYVEWHMREAWRELMFADTDQAAKATRDPVAPAKRSKAAQVKAASHTLDDGTPAHSFSTLLADLAGIVRNTCRTPNAAPDAPTFQVITIPNTKQQRAFELLRKLEL